VSAVLEGNVTTCVIVGLLVTCTNVQPQPPAVAAAVLLASDGPRVPPAWADGPPSWTVPGPPAPRPSFAEYALLYQPRNWTSVTTWAPRHGPPVTVFDLGLYGMAFRKYPQR